MKHVSSVPIAAVKVGKRFRRNLGDLQPLADSIKLNGLLHPIVVTTGNELVCGARRLAACKALGWSDVPVHIVDLEDVLAAECDENIVRLDFTPEEAVEIAAALRDKALEEAKAQHREGSSRGGRSKARINNPSLQNESARATAKQAAAVGMSRQPFEKAKAVVEAAREDRKAFGDLVEMMNRTRKVDPAFKEMKRRRAEAKRRKAAEGIGDLAVEGFHHGDFRTVAERIPDGSLSLIFTDPQYDRESLPVYGDLARIAAAKLGDGGSLITYLGQYQIGEVMALVRPHLRYWWTLAVIHTGQPARMSDFGVLVKWKPLLWFVKGRRADERVFLDDAVMSSPEKDFHPWQQSTKEAAYYIEKLVPKGGLVFDPFCGGGTTAAACKQLGIACITCDTDEASIRLAKGRLAG
jgi:ParB/RepB/Spo0J family partition protein